MTLSQSDLEAYLDEALPAEQMARVEKILRDDPELIRQASAVHSRRNAGVHSLGEIWRAARLSCLSREQLGSFLLGVLPDEVADYVGFHLNVIGCRCCLANLADLKTDLVAADGADPCGDYERKRGGTSEGADLECHVYEQSPSAICLDRASAHPQPQCMRLHGKMYTQRT
jgi:hypothetical protein